MWPGAGCPTARIDADRAGGSPQTLKLLGVVANYSGFRRAPGEEQDAVTNLETKHHFRQKHWAGFMLTVPLKAELGTGGPPGGPEGLSPFLVKATTGGRGPAQKFMQQSHEV